MNQPQAGQAGTAVAQTAGRISKLSVGARDSSRRTVGSSIVLELAERSRNSKLPADSSPRTTPLVTTERQVGEAPQTAWLAVSPAARRAGAV